MGFLFFPCFATSYTVLMFDVLDAVKCTGDGQSERLKPALGPSKFGR